MARDAGVPLARPAARVGLAAVTCGLLAGCGGDGAPFAPTATTTPAGVSPTPAAVSFLHLRHEGGDIDTYQIDGSTGRLQFAVTQRLGDVRALAGDPDGHHVYMAYGPPDRSASGRQDASIVLYEADPAGRLVGLSEAFSRPWEAYATECWGNGWTWLAASRSRVWGLWKSTFASFCHHDSFTSVSHGVSADGQLATAVVGGFWEDFGAAALDPEADVLYKSRLGGGWSGSGAMTSHVVTPDGRLKTMGTTSLCVASPVEVVNPLVAARGYVFGSTVLGVWPHSRGAVCSWEGPRLAPRASVATVGPAAAAFSPPDAASPALLAMAGFASLAQHATDRKTELQLLSTRDGYASLLDTVELQARIRQLLFHPSGRFLYAADEDGRLLSYSVGPAARLELIESVPDAAHSSNPYDPVPFMAVSTRPGVPRP